MMNAAATEQYEQILRCLEMGKLTVSVEKYVSANKWILKLRNPKHFCLDHRKYEDNCRCEVS